ncbi:MAG TPA: hypothetical protein PLP33_10465 [Leptospiraceae bacterium]|nr:hypothetical protein [Leptospiraceae bacterium]
MTYTKQITLPSKKISLIDVKEPTNFNVKFQYNFFTKNERTSFTYTNIPKRFRSINLSDLPLDTQQTNDFNSRIPRYNILNWTPVVIGNNTQIASSIKIQNNIKQIYYEDDFSYENYSVLEIQDLSPEKKVRLFCETLLKSINEKTNKPLLETIKTVNKNTDKNVKPELISAGYSHSDYGLSFYKDNGEKLDAETYIKLLREVKSDIQVNNKLLADVIEFNANTNLLNPTVDEFQEFLTEAKKIQKQAETQNNSNLISQDEFDFEIKDYITQKVLFSTTHTPIVQSIGYLIEKIELKPDGTQMIYPVSVVENPNKARFIDTEVKYGATYLYSIRAVYYIEVEAVDEKNGLISALGILVASRAVSSNSILCKEFTPPPPPQDVSFKYIPEEKAIKISWNFPVNPQMDIKKFQIFKRYSVYEPFQLLKEYDFDDSEVKELSGEFPDLTLVEILNSPKTIFYDFDFSNKKSVIYSLVSIDAHGISSGYSTQYKVSYDKIFNKIEIEPISISGAPKSYPNIFLNEKAFSDSIRDQNHTSVEIFFNPEYLRLYNKTDNELGLLAIGEKNSYQIQFINLDISEQQILSIRLNDKTENVIKEPIDSAFNLTLLKRSLNSERIKGINLNENLQTEETVERKIDSLFKKQ